MKNLTSILLGLILSGVYAEARLGETLDQCIDRYGPVVEKNRATLAGSDAEAAVFSKSGITIITEYKDGVVWSVTYKKKGLSLGEIEALLEANKTTGTWSAPLKLGDLDYRISGDRSRIASFSTDKPTTIGTLSILTQPFTVLNRAEYLARSVAPKEVTGGKDSAKPLTGF